MEDEIRHGGLTEEEAIRFPSKGLEFYHTSPCGHKYWTRLGKDHDMFFRYYAWAHGLLRLKEGCCVHCGEQPETKGEN